MSDSKWRTFAIHLKLEIIYYQCRWLLSICRNYNENGESKLRDGYCYLWIIAIAIYGSIHFFIKSFFEVIDNEVLAEIWNFKTTETSWRTLELFLNKFTTNSEFICFCYCYFSTAKIQLGNFIFFWSLITICSRWSMAIFFTVYFKLGYLVF